MPSASAARHAVGQRGAPSLQFVAVQQRFDDEEAVFAIELDLPFRQLRVQLGALLFTTVQTR
ncbi:MAG: hypothetical protein OXC27_02600, partial [Caldilineaceae bacterium]|nr:hypothetical protein [Caldilineaceae bacterium]